MTDLSRIRARLIPAALVFVFTLVAGVHCAAQVPVLTQHNDNARDGLNPNETILNTTNVNVNQFGKLFSLPVDGQVYAQPLYVPNVTFPGNLVHNVLIVATQNDSVYAFDADSGSGTPLWTASLIDWEHGGTSGETPILNAPSVLGCTAINPQVGIISTPVIDTTTTPTATIYVVAKSVNGSTYINRLHALDITTGAEKSQGPVVISATVSGSGDASQNGTLAFNPQYEFNRAGLLLVNGYIYMGFASVCYPTTFHGWIFSYNETTFEQKSVFATTPNGVRGGVWNSGAGMSADSSGNIYVATGDGTYDTSVPITDFGDAILKLSTSNNDGGNGELNLSDYFVPYDQATLLTDDTDLGSGGVLLLPDQATGGHTHELVQAGKEGRIYLVDRDQMTSNPSNPALEEPYCASNCTSDPQIVQESPFDTGAIFGSPAYWNNTVYFWGVGDVLRSIPVSNGVLNYAAMTTNGSTLGFPGSVPAISSNGTASGSAILWAINATQASKQGPSVLLAYDASNLSTLLWSSSEAPGNRDQAGDAVKFATPTITNGKVYIGTATEVDVYGLLPLVTPVAVTLGPGQTEQFTANGSGQTVTWSIVSPGVGAISNSGLYTAPATVTTASTVTIQASFSGGSMATATVTLTTGSTAGGATVSFVGSDAGTSGNWQKNYGGDGYDMAAVTPQIIPSYATLAANQVTYTWNSNTTDPRALQFPSGSGGIASAWYSQSSMSFSVNISDKRTHQVALYAIDWDGQGRSETIQVQDATSNAILDTETLSNFTGGTYLVWDISGNVKINVTNNSGPNVVVSGFFFGGAASVGSSIQVTVNPPTVNLTGSQTQQFSATVTGTTNQSVTWTYSPEIGTLTSNGFYTAPDAISTQTVTITATSTVDTTKSASATINLTGGAVANFVKLDSNTQGNWQGVYGADGSFIAQYNQVIPDYASFSVTNDSTSAWASGTSVTDPRALEMGSGLGRIAASWYSYTGFSFNVNTTDGNLHQFALYALDWDNQSRSTMIQVADATTGAVLDSRTISSFANGMYVVWNISGNVNINITPVSGPNAVISAAFFDPATTSGPEAVVVTPGSIALSAGGTQQFSAAIQNGPSQAITWSIASVAPTGAAPGTLSATTAGFYTAPSAVTTAETVTVQASLADGTVGTATISLNPTVVTGPSATFVKSDTSTQGSWQGKYGSNGYGLAGVSPQAPPSYAAFQVQNQSNWTWASTTSDPRALEIPGGTTGIASTWYNGYNFSISINVTDNAIHQLALYAVDWDAENRSEKIQILNAANNAVLDTETLSSFYNGAYMVWDITGSVIVNVSTQAGPNSVISGIFFDSVSGGGGTETVTVNPPTANLNAGGTQQFGATVTNGTGTPTWSVLSVSPNGAPAGSFTTTTSGLYQAPATVTESEVVSVQALSADGKASGTATVNLSPTASGGTETVTVNPPSTNLNAGGSQQFSATVTNGTGTPTWSVLSVSPTGAPGGSFTTTTSGIYQAPVTVTESEVVTVQALSADGKASGTATVNLSPTASGDGNSATFVTTDTTTEGSWKNSYGADGYDLAGVSATSIPSYVTNFQVQNQSNWTWASSTSDPRALQIPGGSSGIAATWYGTNYGSNAFSFSMSVTGTHQVAFYVVDWDSQGRSETVQILDASTQKVLDSRQISSFTNGAYLVWNISGNVTVNVVLNSGPNAVISGVFFGGGSSSGPQSPQLSITKTHTGSFSQGQQNATYTVIVSNGGDAGPTSEQVTVTETVPSGLTLVSMAGNNWTCASNVCNRSDALSAGSSYDPIMVTVNVSANASSPQVNQVSVSGGGSASANATDSTVIAATSSGPSSVSFVGFDSTTQGNWMGVYGQDGYVMALGTTQLPSYVSEVTPENQLNYLWAQDTTDVRALQSDSTGDRLAATWYNNVNIPLETFSIDVNVTASTPQRVALYAVDFTYHSRVETVQVVDATSGNVLDTETIGQFTNGIYMVWNISGHVTFNVTCESGENAVISAVLFGGTNTLTTVHYAPFVTADATTQGSWENVYGKDGYYIADVANQKNPSYATFSVQNESNWTWATDSSDPRALETPGGPGGTASCWYNLSGLDFTANVTDGGTHQMSMYAVDWDRQNRAELIQLVDANSGAVLNTYYLSNFTNGVYLAWNISGNVKVNISLTAGANAVVSGVFFDP